MRKELRLGFGLGGLALLFVVTFLVVKRHTENQTASESPVNEVVVDATTAEANTPASTVGPAARPVGPVLPPLGPVDEPDRGTSARSTPPAAQTAQPEDDVFARRETRTVDAPMPPRAGRNAPARPTTKQDWDRILANGEFEGRPTPVVAGNTAVGSLRPANTEVKSIVDRPKAKRRDTSDDARPIGAVGRVAGNTGRSYVIREGDTFVAIAERVYGNQNLYLKIEEANPKTDPTRLIPGQTIVLPELLSAPAASPRGPYNRGEDNRPINSRYEYRVEGGDSLYRISVLVYGSPKMVDEIYAANRSTIGADPGRLRLGMILRLPRPTDRADLR